MNSTVDLNLLSLTEPSDGLFRETVWKNRSQRRDQEFFIKLQSLYENQQGSVLKSKPASGIDLYHDLVVRHLPAANNRAALLYRALDYSPAKFRDFRSESAKSSLGMCALSYAELHESCTERCRRWQAIGLKEGDSLCIVSGVEPELFIALLSAFRLGLQVTVLPPYGPAFLGNRLAVLDKVKISALARYETLLRSFQKDCLFVEKLPNPHRISSTPVSSVTYNKEHPVLALFSPFCRFGKEPKPNIVDAVGLFCHLLRDGLVPLALFPGAILAAPGCDPLQYLPSLFLCTLFHGATYLHLGLSDLLTEGVMERPNPCVDILVICRELRDVILDQSRLDARVSTGFARRCVLDAMSRTSTRWDDFAKKMRLTGVPCSTLLFDAGAGGGLLFSKTQLSSFPRYLEIALGSPIGLERPGSPSENATPGSIAIFDSHSPGCGILLSCEDAGLLYCGTMEPSCEGKPYPKEEVCRVVSELPFVVDCAVFCDVGDRGHTSLLVFTGPEPIELARAWETQRIKLIRELITQKLHVSALPVLVELFAMYPRRQGPTIDLVWCEREYVRGALRTRETDPMYRGFDGLRATYIPKHKSGKLEGSK